MKSIWATALLMIMLQPMYKQESQNSFPIRELPVAGNVIVITIDGFRWQEVFYGADSSIINSEKFTPDTSTTKLLYWDSLLEERRKKLLPFFWNVIAKKGQLYGNRQFKNKVNVANLYSLSYPGYNEMFTGNADISISSNRKIKNPNINVFEYLQSKDAFKGKVAIFSSWDVFPYILNTERNDLPVNSGYQNLESNSFQQQIINAVQSDAIYDKTATRHDQLTFLTAKEYIRQHKPRLAYISLGETDEFAHEGRYDLYLQHAAQADKMIGELWNWVQTTPGYKNNTTFIITTDHGRGSRASKWSSHGQFINGSSQTWLVLMGPGINPLGEVKEEEQFYQSQIAQTIAGILGEKFSVGYAAPSISLR